MQLKRFYFFLLIIAVIFGVLTLFVQERGAHSTEKKSQETVLIRIRDAVIAAERADTSEKRAEGLGGRETMEANAGMFFVFDKADFYPFWMKDMKFPLDIIWIGEDFTITDIQENIQPETFPQTFVSDVPSRYVLEVHAGFSTTNGFVAGDRVLLDQREEL